MKIVASNFSKNKKTKKKQSTLNKRKRNHSFKFFIEKVISFLNYLNLFNLFLYLLKSRQWKHFSFRWTISKGKEPLVCDKLKLYSKTGKHFILPRNMSGYDQNKTIQLLILSESFHWRNLFYLTKQLAMIKYNSLCSSIIHILKCITYKMYGKNLFRIR